MSANPLLPAHELQEIACPFVEPRIAYQTHEPRKGTNLTLIEGKTFVSTSDSGDISPPGAPDVGFFHDDTRFLSQLELKLGGLRTVVLSSSNERTFASTIELTTGSATLRETIDLPENTIHIRREQLLGGNQFFDYVTLENFNQQPVELTLELVYSADFMDVFQIRGTARNRCGHYFVPVANGNQVRFSYRGLDNIFRTTQILFNPAPDMISDSIPTVCTFRVRLEPGRRTRIETVISAHLAESEQRRSHPADFRDSIHRRRRHFET